MLSKDKNSTNGLPVFGQDIVDDWSWDREEEELRERNESESDKD